MKKTILIFGANGFLAKAFINKFESTYHILPVYKTSSEHKNLAFDFFNEDFDAFAKTINYELDGILFLQGLNPTKGIEDITPGDFKKMTAVNLIAPLFLIRILSKKIKTNASIIFISSIAKKKGSYDPSYATAKAGINGLIASLANAYPNYRFNSLSLGLVENSPVFNTMTLDFKKKHAERMHRNQFIQVQNVLNGLEFLINNTNINKQDIAIDGGYL